MLKTIFGKKHKGEADKPSRGVGLRKLSDIDPSVVVPSSRSGGSEEGDTPAGSDVVILGGVRFAPQEMETTDELSMIVFDSIINETIKLDPYLFSRIAVAKLSGQSKSCILFVDRETIAPDYIEAVVTLLNNLGYQLRNDGIQGHFASSHMVLALSQGHINPQSLRTAREQISDPSKNALFSTFMDVCAWAYQNDVDDIDFVVDLHSPTSKISFKTGGRYVHPQRYSSIPTETMIQILGMAWQRSKGGASAMFEVHREQQSKVEIELRGMSVSGKPVRLRLRWQGIPNDKGTVVTMRVQRLGTGALINSLDDAGYLPSQLAIMRRNMHSEGGLIVLAGVVGSGKSTTLASMLRTLPDDMKKMSIEDPVELEIPGMYQKTVTRELTSSGDDPAMTAATRAIFRSALDVLYIGEIRDQLTGMLARTVVESGHTVYTTLHARSALGVIDRLASPAIGVPRDVLAAPGIVKLLVYQLLIATLCPHCRKSPDEHAKELTGDALHAHNTYFDRLERLYRIPRSQYRLRYEPGCEHCRREELPELNGLSGRTVAAEMVELDDAMREAILRGNTPLMYRHWRSLASSSFEDENLTGKTAMECAILKAARGEIDPREIENRFMSFETVERERALETAPQSSPPVKEAKGGTVHV